ncbi:MAG: hypothetical protein R2790_03155 [Flavobacterium haoranii]
MEAKSAIYSKLEAFIRKYYINEIIKGTLLFVGIGLLYFIFTLLVEHFLWLSISGRTILFWLFIFVEVFLLVRFIFIPAFKLFKLQKGIDLITASKIIGNHFTEVGDKLLNFLQLSNSNEQSELLLASIDQKAASLQPIPFTNAVDFSKNKKYLPYAILPIIILLLFFVTGNSSIIKGSLNRVVHYETAYTPPAPFNFFILNDNLQVEQNKSFVLKVTTKGNIQPNQIKINFGNESYFLENLGKGFFEYTFDNVSSSVNFSLEANDVVSQDYELNVINVPTISNFEMQLVYPKYLGKVNEVIKGTGNAQVPEGTKVFWSISAQSTSNIKFISNATENFSNNDNQFSFAKTIVNDLDYDIVTSNKAISNYEKLSYAITTVKDQFPTINASFAPDSLKLNNKVIIGQVADDYGLSKLQIVYYDVNDKTSLKKGVLPVKKDLVDRFVYTFPNGLSIEAGKQYEYYFEVFDNDQVNGNKSSKSSTFQHYELTSDEKTEKNLQDQQENIDALEKSLKNQDKQLSELDKLQKLNKEKSSLDNKDQKKVQDFIEKQKLQDEMMKEFSKKLNENLEEFKPNSKEKEELQRRLDEFEKESEKNEKLLKELEELSQKLEKDKLFDKADKLKQNAKTQKMNLEQLVELTKRFYVEQKANQIADKLDKLGDKQKDLANKKDENNSKNQEALTKEFDDIKKDLDELSKENNELKKPLDLDRDSKQEDSISKDQENAQDNLEKNDQQNAGKSQKKAGDKMKQMSQQMSSAMSAGGAESMQEDAKLLRQILDNLLTFSFDQEQLMNIAKNNSKSSIQLNQILKKQQELKVQFKHIDDSLFAVALRNVQITEMVFKEVGEVHYNVDKSLESFSESYFPKGVSHQQFAFTSANRLADFLSNIQSQMMMQMQGSGQGKPKPGQGQGMQLPDIIKKQSQLGEQMKEGMKSGEQPGDKPGEKSGQQNKGNQGSSSGQDGENGSEGNAGKVLDILKQQKELRDALQKSLEKEGLDGIGQNALNQMKDIEKQLINKSFKNETLNKMLNLKHELLKLEKAIQQQGEDKKRQSETNKDSFSGSKNTIQESLKEYLNSIEILNRQSLPLQPNFNTKVQEYFKANDKF